MTSCENYVHKNCSFKNEEKKGIIVMKKNGEFSNLNLKKYLL